MKTKRAMKTKAVPMKTKRANKPTMKALTDKVVKPKMKALKGEDDDEDGDKVDAKTAKQMKAIGFEFNAWRAGLENVRFKANSNGVDWFVAKCPACSADKPKGEDTKGHRLNFSEEGAICCKARQCTYWEIAGIKKPEVKE